MAKVHMIVTFVLDENPKEIEQKRESGLLIEYLRETITDTIPERIILAGPIKGSTQVIEGREFKKEYSGEETIICG
jgi:hypothetical protein